MLRQLRHDVWATEQLIGYCRGLKPDQLDLTVPGTYGSIRRSARTMRRRWTISRVTSDT